LNESPTQAPQVARSNVRMALVLASASRYGATLVGLLSTFVIARLLTPTEFGLSVLGGAIFPIAEAIRDLGSVAYIVQHKDLSRDRVRTAFTVSLLVTGIMTAAILALAHPLARFFDAPVLAPFIQIVAFQYAMGPFVHPIYALMSRDLAFGRIAIMETATTLVQAGASVLLVSAGYGILGVAAAGCLSAALAVVICFSFQPGFWIYRPTLRHRREMLSFMLSGSTAALLARTAESVSMLLLGKLLGAHATGLLQRAMLIAFWPERIVLAGPGAVALPAFATLVREGRPLAPHYLRIIALASALDWSALVTVALLAGPLVHMLLGPGWDEVVPLVQIMVLSAVFTFPNGLNGAVQTAAGGIGQTPLIVLLQYGSGLLAVIVGAQYGPYGVAWSLLAAAPFGAAVSTMFARRWVHFSWGAFARSLTSSLLPAATTALAVWTVVTFSGLTSPTLLSFAGLAASAVGLLTGLALAPHPLSDEALRLARGVLRRVRRLRPAPASAPEV
jgi:O-antigen/teichoic acid export membrane protein